MNIRLRLLVLILAILPFAYCKDGLNSICGGDYVVMLSNNSTNPICVFAYFKKDTIPIIDEKQSALPIKNGEREIVFESTDKCENYKDTVHYFIMYNDTLKRYGLKQTLDTYNVILRYSLTGDDFHKLDYTIPYPPSPSMKDMTMYPPYEEIIRKSNNGM